MSPSPHSALRVTDSTTVFALYRVRVTLRVYVTGRQQLSMATFHSVHSPSYLLYGVYSTWNLQPIVSMFRSVSHMVLTEMSVFNDVCVPWCLSSCTKSIMSMFHRPSCLCSTVHHVYVPPSIMSMSHCVQQSIMSMFHGVYVPRCLQSYV